MYKKIVGLDLDYTLVKFEIDFWDAAAKKLGIKKGCIPPPTRFGIDTYPRVIRDTMYKMFCDPFYMCNLIKVPFLNYFIKWLCRRGNTVYIITARHHLVQTSTKKWLRNYIGSEYYNNVLFVPPHTSKKEMFKEINIDIWVDDNEKDVITAVEMGIETYHITDTPWGKVEVPGAKRVKGLYNIIDIHRDDK